MAEGNNEITEWIIDELNKDIARLNRNITKLNEEIDEIKKKDIRERGKMKTTKKRKKSTKKQKRAKKNQKTTKKNQKIAKKLEEISKNKTEILEKKNLITQQKIAGPEGDIAELKKEIAGLKGDIAELEEFKASKQITVKQIQEKNKKIRGKAKEIKDKEEEIAQRCSLITEEMKLKRPSKLGVPKTFVCYQSALRIFCHRPLGRSKTHTSLYYEPFATFMKGVGDTYELGKGDGDIAAELVEKMTQLYPSEKKREDALKNVLQRWKIDGIYFGSIMNSTKEARTDITAYLSIDEVTVPIANVELKNDLGASTACAVCENIAYYLHLSVDHSLDIGGLKPMLLICMVGCHYMQAFGAITVNGEAYVDPLSEPISLLYVPQTSCIEKVAQFLLKMKELLLALETYYEAPPMPPRQFPYVMNSKEKFQYDKALKNGVFSGKYKKYDAVIKFCRTYGKEVHECLVEKRFAPELLYDGHVHMFKVIIMEFVSGTHFSSTDDQPGSLDLLPDTREILKKGLKEICKVLHKKKYVHGDLRCPNIILSGSKVYVVGFDWSCEEDDGYYPLDMVKNNQWAKGVAREEKLWCEDDERMAVRLLSSCYAYEIED